MILPTDKPRITNKSILPWWAALFFVGLILCVVAFPKGGIKIDNIPVTWSYLYIGLGFIPPVLMTFLSRKNTINPLRFVSLLLLIPIQTLIVFGLISEGYDDFGNTASLLTNWFVLPGLLLVLWGFLFDAYPLDTIYKTLRWVLPFTATYGILLFFYKQSTGDYFQIPYLTVNVDDMETLANKHNMRGDVSKLISTYNNGNIYGVCMLMLYPLYRVLERNVILQWLVLGALILTLSRTVWIGILLCELFHLLWIEKASFVIWLKRIAFLLVPAVLGLAMFHFLGYNLSFILDPDLGGRLPQLQSLNRILLLKFESFDVIQEVVYLSVLDLYGAIGLACWLLGLFSCMILYYLGRRHTSIPTVKKSIILGLIIYLILSGSDGAFLLIPTMAIFWLLSSLLLSPHLSGTAVKRP